MSQIRFDRLQQLKEIDAKAFNLPIDDERVEHCATIALAIEDQRALLVAGKGVDHQVTLSLSAERRLWIKELVPPPPQPALRVEWVHGIGICPQCKYRGPDRHCTKCRAELSEADEDAIEECGTERRADKRSRPAPSPTTAETPPIAAAKPAPAPPPVSDAHHERAQFTMEIIWSERPRRRRTVLDGRQRQRNQSGWCGWPLRVRRRHARSRWKVLEWAKKRNCERSNSSCGYGAAPAAASRNVVGRIHWLTHWPGGQRAAQAQTERRHQMTARKVPKSDPAADMAAEIVCSNPCSIASAPICKSNCNNSVEVTTWHYVSRTNSRHNRGRRRPQWHGA